MGQEGRGREDGTGGEGQGGWDRRGVEGRMGHESQGGGEARGEVMYVGLSIAVSFLQTPLLTVRTYLEEQPLLLFVEVTAENVPEPQDHTMSGMVPTIVHRVVPVGEGGEREGGRSCQTTSLSLHCNTHDEVTTEKECYK